MVSLPDSEDLLVVRTDFSDPGGWEATRRAILAPGAEAQLYAAPVEFVDDEGFAGYAPEQFLDLIGEGPGGCLFIVDKTTVSSPDWPVLVMDLEGERGRVFRVIADEISEIAGNALVGKINLSEYADYADERGGILRRRGGPSRSEIIASLREAVDSGKWPGEVMKKMMKPGPPIE